MKKLIVCKASVALAAVVALIVNGAAFAGYPSIVSSFRMSGAVLPRATGIFTWERATAAFGILYAGPNRHSLWRFTTGGSLMGTYSLSGGVTLADADYAPRGSASGCFAVVDTGANALKLYDTVGSYYGSARALPNDVVAYGVGGHVTAYDYFGTRDGVISRYTREGSFLNSFATGVPIGALAAGRGYGGYWGCWVIVGRSDVAELRGYDGGSGGFAGSFALPGISVAGAIYGGWTRSTMWCVVRSAGGTWAYEIETGPLMPVEPASLGKVKALFK